MLLCSHEAVRVDSAGTRPQSRRSSSRLTAESNEARYDCLPSSTANQGFQKGEDGLVGLRSSPQRDSVAEPLVRVRGKPPRKMGIWDKAAKAEQFCLSDSRRRFQSYTYFGISSILCCHDPRRRTSSPSFPKFAAGRNSQLVLSRTEYDY